MQEARNCASRRTMASCMSAVSRTRTGTSGKSCGWILPTSNNLTRQRRNVMTDMERVMQGVIPYLMIDGADKAIEFYKKAFGAKDYGSIRPDDGQSVIPRRLED